jgi:hypothetical protein
MTTQNSLGRLDTHQSVAFAGTAGTIANPVGTQCRKIRVVVTSAAYVRISNSPPATAADVYFPANWPETVIVNPGQSVSAIQVAAAGFLHVTEIV